jgi:hypothetical protein
MDLLSADIVDLMDWADDVTAALDLLAEQPQVDLSEVLLLLGALELAMEQLNSSDVIEQIEDLQDSVEELNSTLDESSSASEDAEDAAVDAKNLSMIAIALVVIAILAIFATSMLARRQRQE